MGCRVVWLLMIGFCIVCIGCTSPAQDRATAAAAQQVWIGSVRDGTTRIGDISKKLGPPTATYADGKAMVYRLLLPPRPLPFFWASLTNQPKADFKGIAPLVIHGDYSIDDRKLADDTEWDFVAVLDGKGVVQRHSMLAVQYVWGVRYTDLHPIWQAPAPKPVKPSPPPATSL